MDSLKNSDATSSCNTRSHPSRIMNNLSMLRKIHWKLRWKLFNKPMVIRRWHQGLRISLPSSGSAAQIYYRKYSEPHVAEWMVDHLQEGDCFVDIGAHVGEYSLIAATSIGPAGSIIALEPQHDLCKVIAKNFSDNQINNARVIHGALGEHNGRCHLFTDSRTKGAVLDTNSAEADIPMFNLETLLKDVPENTRIWMKLDAAGYELPCLTACKEYLKRRPIHLILKAYHQREVIQRFPGISSTLAGFLGEMSYQCLTLKTGSPVRWAGHVEGYCETVICAPHQATTRL
jgi:FkbM family methyltransferase